MGSQPTAADVWVRRRLPAGWASSPPRAGDSRFLRNDTGW